MSSVTAAAKTSPCQVGMQAPAQPFGRPVQQSKVTTDNSYLVTTLAVLVGRGVS